MVVLQEKLAHMNCSASPCEEGGGSCDTFGITDDDDNVATFDACVKGDVLSLADMLRNPAKLRGERRGKGKKPVAESSKTTTPSTPNEEERMNSVVYG